MKLRLWYLLSTIGLLSACGMERPTYQVGDLVTFTESQCPGVITAKLDLIVTYTIVTKCTDPGMTFVVPFNDITGLYLGELPVPGTLPSKPLSRLEE